MLTSPILPTIPGRLERVREWLAQEDLDCVVVAGPAAVTHLAGYWRYFGSPAAVILDRDGQMSLVVVYDEAAGAEEMLPGVRVHAYGDRGFGLVPDQVPPLTHAVAALPAVCGAERIAVGGEDQRFGRLLTEMLGHEVTDGEGALTEIRLVKDAAELEAIRRAYELAWIAQDRVRDDVAPEKREIDLFTAGQGAAQLAAGEPIAFFGDLLCGPRTADVCAPVRVAGATAAGAGSVVVSDLVVGLRGYWGDTAETYCAGPNREAEGVREQLITVLERAARELVPGQSAAQVYRSMQAQISETFPGGEFPHHGGHGVGLGSYEDPHIIDSDDSELRAGMVIALEPGVYFPGRYGVRVERMYVVGDGGGVELRASVQPANEDREQ